MKTEKEQRGEITCATQKINRESTLVLMQKNKYNKCKYIKYYKVDLSDRI